MAKVLPPSVQEEIYNALKSAYSDFHLFESLVASKLWQCVKDTDHVEINVKTTKRVVERYYDMTMFQSKEQKSLLAQIQQIFQTCYVLVLSYHDHGQALLWPDVTTLKLNYPQFACCDETELNFLLKFRNMMRVALLIIPAYKHKQNLLRIAARLEGSHNEYITGGGQKASVTRRVDIYEKEGGVISPKARAPTDEVVFPFSPVPAATGKRKRASSNASQSYGTLSITPLVTENAFLSNTGSLLQLQNELPSPVVYEESYETLDDLLNWHTPAMVEKHQSLNAIRYSSADAPPPMLRAPTECCKLLDNQVIGMTNDDFWFETVWNSTTSAEFTISYPQFPSPNMPHAHTASFI